MPGYLYFVRDILVSVFFAFFVLTAPTVMFVSHLLFPFVVFFVSLL